MKLLILKDLKKDVVFEGCDDQHTLIFIRQKEIYDYL